MTTPSFHEQTGISINVSQSVITDIGTGPTELTNQIGNISFELSAWLLHDNLRFSISTDQIDAESWFDYGLGRHVEVHDAALAMVWEGFVNRVDVSIGPLSASRGPLMDIGNAASVQYSRILDATASPPIVGSGNVTTIAQDADSQALYGYVEKILSGGTCTLDDAERYRDTWLAENALPVTSNRLSPGRGRQASVRVSCLGYWAWLQAYQYTDRTATTVTLSTKIEDVLAADPNSVFSTDYSGLDTNAYLTPAWVDDGSNALDVIQAIVALGDVNDARWLFGIGDGRKARYYEAPTAVEYEHALSDQAQRVTTVGGGAWVKPWDVRPGKWLFLTDFMATRGDLVDLRNDPRAVFIENVRYRAPWGLDINGEKVGNLAQLLAKRAGVGGASA